MPNVIEEANEPTNRNLFLVTAIPMKALVLTEVWKNQFVTEDVMSDQNVSEKEVNMYYKEHNFD